jgi:hypothetical protein
MLLGHTALQQLSEQTPQKHENGKPDLRAEKWKHRPSRYKEAHYDILHRTVRNLNVYSA